MDLTLLEWPGELDLIISALDAARGGATDRRQSQRAGYRTPALLNLFSDTPEEDPWELYTRDADARGIGFMTRDRLPLGYGGSVRLRAPNGQEVTVHCTVLRCRAAAGGWFEGALMFNRPQAGFGE